MDGNAWSVAVCDTDGTNRCKQIDNEIYFNKKAHQKTRALKSNSDEKVAKEPIYKIDGFGEDAMEDTLERLKVKRAANNKEIKYLKALFQRASEYLEYEQRLVNVLFFSLKSFENDIECHSLSISR